MADPELEAYRRRLVKAIIDDAREEFAGRHTTRRADAVRAEWADRQRAELMRQMFGGKAGEA